MKLDNVLYLLGGVGIVYGLSIGFKIKNKNNNMVKTNAIVTETIQKPLRVEKASDKVQPPAPYNPNLTQFKTNEAVSFDGLTKKSKEIFNNEPVAISAILYRGVM